MFARPYQVASIETIRALWGQGKRRIVVCAPTGAGKTKIVEMLIQRIVAADWAATVFCGHSSEIVMQPADRLDDLGIRFGLVRAGLLGDATAAVQVCSAQTLINRTIVPPPITRGAMCGQPHKKALLIIDEAHRCRTSTYHRITERVTAAYETVYVLLLTATPYRRDGRALSHMADTLIEAITPRELIDAGWLMDPTMYSRPPEVDGTTGSHGSGDDREDEISASFVMRQPSIVGDIVKTWEQHALGLPTICQAVNRAHARDIAVRFRAAGHRADVIDGTMGEDARGLLYARLAIDRAHPLALDVLCSGGTILSEGFDSAASYRHVLSRPHAIALARPEDAVPWKLWAGDQPPAYAPLACLIDAAPTTSRGAWIQRMGRICRPFTADDVAEWAERGIRSQVKTRAVVLSHAGNLEIHGFLVQHEGFTLTGDRVGAPRVNLSAYPTYHAPAVTQCPTCFASVPGSIRVTACPTCGTPIAAVQAPRLPREQRRTRLEELSVESQPPPATEEQKEAYLAKMWEVWGIKCAQREAAGQAPLKTGWPSVMYRAKWGEWPQWGTNQAFARMHGVRR